MNIRTKLLARFVLVSAVLWSNGTEDLLAQAGHRIDRSANQVVVGSDHWDHWEFAPGTIQISPLGEVQPNRVYKNTNAALDIVDFLRYNPQITSLRKSLKTSPSSTPFRVDPTAEESLPR